MAKSSPSRRLPDPETYGREMAARKQKAARQHREMLDNINTMSEFFAGPEKILKGLEAHVALLASLQETLETSASGILESINGLSAEIDSLGKEISGLGDVQRDIDSLKRTVEQGAKAADARTQQALNAFQSHLKMMDQVNAHTGYSQQQNGSLRAIQSAVEALAARPIPKSERIERDVGPKNMLLQVTGRDDNGDIEFIEVEVH